MLKAGFTVLGMMASLIVGSCAPAELAEPRIEEVPDPAAFEQLLARVVVEGRDNPYLSNGGSIGPVAARRIVLGGGQPDLTVAYLVGRGWCGSGGCHLAVVQGDGEGARLVGWSTISQPPIQVLPTRSHGLPDLVVTIRNTSPWLAPQHAILSFDGESYPLNPTMPPAVIVDDQPAGQVIVSEEDMAEAIARRPDDDLPPFEPVEEEPAGPWRGDPAKGEVLAGLG